jgi:hypothetical protein
VGVRVGVGAWGGCPQTGHSPSHLKTNQPQCVVLGIYVPEHRKGRDPFAPGLVKKTPLHVARRPWPGEKHIRGGIIYYHVRHALAGSWSASPRCAANGQALWPRVEVPAMGPCGLPAASAALPHRQPRPRKGTGRLPPRIHTGAREMPVLKKQNVLKILSPQLGKPSGRER